MPDPSEPDRHDELIAAYLDGEATAEEIIRVESSPALMAEVEVFRSVADLVADPPPTPDPDVREHHLSTALAASTTAGNVTALATRRPWYRRPITAAAAVIVAVVLAIPLLAQLGDNGDADMAGEPTAVSDGTDAATDDSGDEGAATAELDRSQIDELDQSAPAEASGGDGATAADTEGAASPTTAARAATAQSVVIGRLAAENETFADYEAAIEAYEQLIIDADDGEADATEFYEIIQTEDVARRCLQSFGLGVIVVADVDGTDVLLGRADGETIVVATRSCAQLFPE